MTSTERFVDASLHVATISALRVLTIQRNKSNFVDEENTMDTLGVTYIQEISLLQKLLKGCKICSSTREQTQCWYMFCCTFWFDDLSGSFSRFISMKTLPAFWRSNNYGYLEDVISVQGRDGKRKVGKERLYARNEGSLSNPISSRVGIFRNF